MKKKHLFFTVALLTAMSANAQETYENARLTDQDLNGTARYVGMGGALDALGADISTISSNPAGLGLFRHHTLNVSGGLLMQSNATKFNGDGKTNVSFDQIGGVYSTRTGKNSYLNFGFNYHKGKNFDQILNAAGALNGGSSLNRQTYNKALIGREADGGFYAAKNTKGEYSGYVDENSKDNAYTFNQLDYINMNGLIADATGTFGYFDAKDYTYDRSQRGYIGNYDFNISGNIHDRIYLGATFGIKDVHYKAYSEYSEGFTTNSANYTWAGYANSQKITGTGFDVAVGIIVRPFESSPFRIGAYVKTPTWYDLTTTNTTGLTIGTASGRNTPGGISNSYDYKFYTPWKFGLSLGHTVGNYLALGASWDYEDYSRINSRINDGGSYDWFYDEYYESSSADHVMNNHTKHTLKAVSTLKLGVEYKPVENLALRFGYNYVSPAYKESGQKDTRLASLGNAYSSDASYTNWKATNRVTVGVGYQIKKFNIDLAYQYSAQKGDFYPFSSYSAQTFTTPAVGTTPASSVTTIANGATATSVKNNRSQLLLTLGYRL